jgi:hypothetical protein
MDFGMVSLGRLVGKVGILGVLLTPGGKQDTGLGENWSHSLYILFFRLYTFVSLNLLFTQAASRGSIPSFA